VRVYVYPDAFAMVPMLFLDYESIDADPAGGKRYYVIADQRGCVERVLDDEGAIVWKAQIDAHGVARIEVGHDFYQPLRFPGHWYDAELALNYNRFRYYSPEHGCYLQSDPWGIASNVNTYAYVSTPLTYVDVLGLGCEVLQSHTLRNPDGSETLVEVVRTAAGEVMLRVSTSPTRLGRRPWMAGAYHGPKPPYANPGHHDPTSGMFRGGGGRTSVLPGDAEQVYRSAIPDADGAVWYGRNSNGDTYVYRPTNDGTVHWAGSSSTERGVTVPKDVRRRFSTMDQDRDDEQHGGQ
jgi:RHS repeat-associated protein